jgi:pimeloyl-ACP methyl ester carboxylesterase
MVTPVTIVYLHGMAGGHLKREGGSKVWLSAAGLVRGSSIRELQGALNPAGHIKLFHRPAALYWRSRGLTVYEFAYDWRLSLDDAAWKLRDAVASLADRSLLIVAHSMGGCVACRFSALYPKEAARVERAYFFGVPVRGTFAAAEVLLGQFRMLRLIAGASLFRRKQVLADLRAAGAAMPGLIDLLPDPELFPAARVLYERRNWPPEGAPEQQDLDRALTLKREMLRSPILERTTVLAASNWATAGEVHLAEAKRTRANTAPGDGVTPIASALPLAGMPLHPLRFPHAFLLFEPSGLREVVRLQN